MTTLRNSDGQEIKDDGWVEIKGGHFYRNNGDGTCQHVLVENWDMEVDSFLIQANKSKRMDVARQYQATYGFATIR